MPTQLKEDAEKKEEEAKQQHDVTDSKEDMTVNQEVSYKDVFLFMFTLVLIIILFVFHFIIIRCYKTPK